MNTNFGRVQTRAANELYPSGAQFQVGPVVPTRYGPERLRVRVRGGGGEDGTTEIDGEIVVGSEN